MTTISRREFMWTAAGAALTPVRPVGAFAAKSDSYDLVIVGGRVLDPSARLDGVRDIAIAGGRIAKVADRIEPGAAKTLDARGKLVVPGLIDIHTHAGRSADAPKMLLEDGVTGWIDAGSQGADHVDDAVAVARSSPQPAAILINIGRAGILPEGDTMNLANADVAAARAAITRNRQWIAGVKARLSADVAGANDYEVLKRAQDVASAFDIPVMIHMGQTMSPLPKLLALLKRGDVVTHMYAPAPNGILDDRGQLLPEVLAARRRGIWFDVGNGRIGHLRWDVVDTVKKQQFWPDTISTDWGTNSRSTGVIDLPNCMSKLLVSGMPLMDVIAAATATPARVFPVFKARGTLKAGAPADVAILELRSGSFEFVDNYDNKIMGPQRLFPSATVLGGARVHG